MNDKTRIFNLEEVRNYTVTEVLMKTKKFLDEKGYNGINQIVGYLTTGDIKYISSYKNANELMESVPREQIVETILKYYLKDEKWNI